MSARIYRHEMRHRVLVAEFDRTEDALLCIRGMTYSLGERLIMTTDGSDCSICPTDGIRFNGNREFVSDLGPTCPRRRWA